MSLESPSVNRLIPQVASQSGITVRQLLLLGIGLLLPLISLVGKSSSFSSTNLMDRIVPVDVVLLVLVADLVLSKQFNLHAAAKLYMFALVLSLSISLFRAAYEMDAKGILPSAVEFLAAITAFLYLAVGYNTGFHPRLVKALILGVALGVLWEGFIVFHDWMLPPAQQWFPSDTIGRVNGTFRTAAQLGIYGTSAAGILLAMGWSHFRGATRIGIIVLGGAAVLFTAAGSRRSAMISIVVWLFLYLIIGSRKMYSKGYLLSWAVVFIAIILGWVFRDDLQTSFTGERLSEVTTILQPNQESFLMVQINDIRASFEKWFPFGLGCGRGIQISSTGHEIHNAHFALLIESGVIGLAAFYALLSVPIFRFWPANSLTVKFLVISFVLAALVMMVHNRVFRDRGFMLFLGLASSLFLQGDQDESRLVEPDAPISPDLIPKGEG